MATKVASLANTTGPASVPAPVPTGFNTVPPVMSTVLLTTVLPISSSVPAELTNRLPVPAAAEALFRRSVPALTVVPPE